MTRHTWTPQSVADLRRLYPNYTAAVVAKVLGCTVPAVFNKAKALGIVKSAEFLASDKSGRVARGKQHPSMVANQFKPGLTPWNKGTHYVAGGRSAQTRFKPGEMRGAAQHNYVPIGTLRTSKDGYLERKMNDTHPVPARRWVAVHRLVWEAANGPIPDGHIVVFKPGQSTVVEALITVDRLECITRAENMRRNSFRTKHPELVQLYQLKGAINRQVNRIHKEAKA